MKVPLNKLTDRDPKLIQYFVVHHSVADPATPIEDLARAEEASQGFVTIGYNAVIVKDAAGWTIHEGRPMNKLPAAQFGLNETSYAVCIGGNYHPNVKNVPTNTVDPVSLNILIDRINAVKQKAPNLKFLIAHRDVATIKAKHGGNPADFSTACCGDRLYAHMDALRKATGLAKPPEL
ncbi:MAG TPA: hypothetical protein VGC72_19060 [Candidatus Elarobacter sp.]|jgi:hypothetical protein